MSLAAGIRKMGTGRFVLSCTHPIDSLAVKLFDAWPDDETLPDVRCTMCNGRWRKVVRNNPPERLTSGQMMIESKHDDTRA